MIEILKDNYSITVFALPDDLNAEDDNVDVEVELSDGTRYGATFFTPSNLQTLLDRHKATGESCNGLYFGGCRDMVVVEELTPEVIQAVVDHLLAEGQISSVFMELED